MDFYTLKTPYPSRRNGETVQVTELQLPEVVTVGMMRKVRQGLALMAAHDVTEVCSGMTAFDASKLTTPDALGYADSLGDRLRPFDEPGFAVPEIKPVKTLVQKLTADVSQPIEFAAQVLQHSGMKKADIDAMDVRGFLPAVEQIVESFTDPKA